MTFHSGKSIENDATYLHIMQINNSIQARIPERSKHILRKFQINFTFGDHIDGENIVRMTRVKLPVKLSEQLFP